MIPTQSFRRTSTLAECSADVVTLHELNLSFSDDDAENRRLLRKMDRSRRANNPQNYNSDGTIRRAANGERLHWNESNTYRRTKARLKELDRKAAVKRRQENDRLAKKLLSHGDEFIVEKMEFKGLQKRALKTTVNKKNGRFNRKTRFGKAMANRGPSAQIEALARKLSHFGCSVLDVDTAKVKASQYCHITGKCVKKQLYERWNVFEGRKVQRDLYSTFLLMNLDSSLDAVDNDRCRRTYGDFLLLHDREVERIRALPQGNILHWYAR